MKDQSLPKIFGTVLKEKYYSRINSYKRLFGLLRRNMVLEVPKRGFIINNLIYVISAVCSHRRAYYYYQEAIVNNESFVGVACNSYDKFLKKECDAKKSSIEVEYRSPEERYAISLNFYFKK